MAAISPDGQRVAFTTTPAGSQLWVRDLDDKVARLVAVVGVSSQLFWSPDSRSVAFVDAGATVLGKLKRVNIATGRIQTLADAAKGTGAWSASGVIVVTDPEGRISRVPSRAGNHALTVRDKATETGHWWPIFLPDGRRFFYPALCADTSNNASYPRHSTRRHTRTRVARATSFVNYAQGRLFFQRNGAHDAAL